MRYVDQIYDFITRLLSVHSFIAFMKVSKKTHPISTDKEKQKHNHRRFKIARKLILTTRGHAESDTSKTGSSICVFIVGHVTRFYPIRLRHFWLLLILRRTTRTWGAGQERSQLEDEVETRAGAVPLNHLCVGYNYVSTSIRFRFEVDLTAVRLLIKGH